MKRYDVLVIGAGAAGLLAAGTAAAAGAEVLVAEKMPKPARKILMTGKGRCNVTNNCSEEALIRMVRTNPRFLYSAFHAFSSADTMALFEGLGVPLETQRGNRVFPRSEKAMDIADALVRFARQSGAGIAQLECHKLLLEDGMLCGVEDINGTAVYAKTVIVATGGRSYPSTGSSGDGYRLAKQVGHTITPLRASLVAMNTKEVWVRDVMGLSLKNVTLTLSHPAEKKPVFRQQGEMLFTHFGISGPLVLSASAHMTKPPQEYHMAINLKPALQPEELDKRLLRDFAQYHNRDFTNALSELLPKALIPIIVTLSQIPPHTKVHQITKEQRTNLCSLLQQLPLTPASLRPVEEAVITAGGVSVKEVDPRTMQSKLLHGLYFAGEVLDLDAYTGGFNLQIAFSTGHVAGSAAAQALQEYS